MATYELEMRGDECSKTVSIEADTLREARATAKKETGDWIKGGDWGSDGARITACWTLTDDNGEEVDEGGVTVEIEPDHDALIRAACGGKYSSEWERCCGGDPDVHDWTSEGEGGCDSNPGVWSTGGTSMSFASHCKTCGLHRSEHHTGSQRNPGEHDTVSYEMPDQWCAECESEECSCEGVEAP